MGKVSTFLLKNGKKGNFFSFMLGRKAKNRYLCSILRLTLKATNMETTIEIRCKNNGQTVEVPMGSSLEEIYGLLGLEMKNPPVIARVNNKVEGLHFKVYKQKDVE